jgi:hypothetical protein
LSDNDECLASLLDVEDALVHGDLAQAQRAMTATQAILEDRILEEAEAWAMAKQAEAFDG